MSSHFWSGGGGDGLSFGHVVAAVFIVCIIVAALSYSMWTAGVDGTTLEASANGRPRIEMPNAYKLPKIASEGAARANGWVGSSWVEWVKHLQATGQYKIGVHPDGGTMLVHRIGRQAMIFSNWCAPKFPLAAGVFLLTLLIVGVGVALSGVSFFAEEAVQVAGGALAGVCAAAGMVAVAGHPVVGDSWLLVARWWLLVGAELVAFVGASLIAWKSGQIFAGWLRGQRVKYTVKIGTVEKVRGAAVVVGRRCMEILPKIAAAMAVSGGENQLQILATDLKKGVGVVGGMGSGKSRFIFSTIDQFRKLFPTVPIFVNDKKCEYLARYFDPARDLIFAPYDERGTAWDVLADIEQDAGLRSVACEAATVATMGNQQQDKTWVLGAIGVVEDVMSCGGVEAATARLREIIQNCNDGGDRTRQSMVSCARGALKDLYAIAHQATATGKPARRLAEFLALPGFVFLPNPVKVATRQAASINIFLSVALAELLSMPDVPADAPPRALFILDEILTLRLPADLTGNFFRIARSKGLAFICAGQDVPNERKNEITEWWGSCERTFLFRVNSDEAAKKISDRIGKAIYDEKTKSETSRSILERQSTTDALQERYHLLFEPAYFRTDLQPRHFIELHPSGIVPGRTLDVADVTPRADELQQSNRDDVIAWERGLETGGS